MKKPVVRKTIAGPTAEAISDYLSKKPWSKARDMAKDLGLTRKSLNSLLHSNTNQFRKKSSGEWALLNLSEEPRSCVGVKPICQPTPRSTIPVKNIDLIDRIRSLLKEFGSLKARAVAIELSEPRITVNRALHSFQNIFQKSTDNSWSIRPDYIDNTTGPDATFTNCGALAEDKLPVAEFRESRAPQQFVIEATLDRNLLVLAPPGVGKTHTLIERLIYAIQNSPIKVDAGELLVLSFTRAAVSEIRQRIAKAIAEGAPSNLRYVQVRTFDAHATWLLNDGGYSLQKKKHDARVQLLTDELQTLTLRQTTARIDRSRYLFVDEVQDLVGVRADMVFELVKRMLAHKGSVTLLGDPHQALNDWQIAGSQTNSAEFLKKIQHHLAEGLEQVELEKSHRYETPEMKSLAVKAKSILDKNEIAAHNKFNQLIQLIPKITTEQLNKKFEEGAIDAMLCRSNREVFQWLDWHKEQGNSCQENLGAASRPWPAWIGQAIMQYQARTMTKEQLLNRLLRSSGSSVEILEENLDQFLTNEGLLRRNSISLESLAFRLQSLPSAKIDDLVDDDMVVSTVHKAKGLEYGRVVVVEPAINKKKGITDEDVRLLYVAITRAKRGIFLLQKKSIPFSVAMTRRRGGHLGYTKHGNKYLQLKGLEEFDLESLFVDRRGGVDTISLKKYLISHKGENTYVIRPESCNKANDHNYALYLISSAGHIRLCAVSGDLKKSLDAMAWGNEYGDDGAMLDLGLVSAQQTIVHPMESPMLTKSIGPAGIMVFPIIHGFYTLSRAKEE